MHVGHNQSLVAVHNDAGTEKRDCLGDDFGINQEPTLGQRAASDKALNCPHGHNRLAGALRGAHESLGALSVDLLTQGGGALFLAAL
jgi:hypothetical protein